MKYEKTIKKAIKPLASSDVCGMNKASPAKINENIKNNLGSLPNLGKLLKRFKNLYSNLIFVSRVNQPFKLLNKKILKHISLSIQIPEVDSIDML